MEEPYVDPSGNADINPNILKQQMADCQDLDEEIQAAEKTLLEHTKAGTVLPLHSLYLAKALICSKSTSYIERGVFRLVELLADTNTKLEREVGFGALYHLALGHYKLGEYRQALGEVDTILRQKSYHTSAVALRQMCISKVVEKQSKSGLLTKLFSKSDAEDPVSTKVPFFLIMTPEEEALEQQKAAEKRAKLAAMFAAPDENNAEIDEEEMIRDIIEEDNRRKYGSLNPEIDLMPQQESQYGQQMAVTPNPNIAVTFSTSSGLKQSNRASGWVRSSRVYPSLSPAAVEAANDTNASNRLSTIRKLGRPLRASQSARTGYSDRYSAPGALSPVDAQDTTPELDEPDDDDLEEDNEGDSTTTEEEIPDEMIEEIPVVLPQFTFSAKYEALKALIPDLQSKHRVETAALEEQQQAEVVKIQTDYQILLKSHHDAQLELFQSQDAAIAALQQQQAALIEEDKLAKDLPPEQQQASSADRLQRMSVLLSQQTPLINKHKQDLENLNLIQANDKRNFQEHFKNLLASHNQTKITQLNNQQSQLIEITMMLESQKSEDEQDYANTIRNVQAAADQQRQHLIQAAKERKLLRQMEKERKAQERADAKRKERERRLAEKIEQKRLEKERLEQERIDRERQETLERERIEREQERQEFGRLEQERLARELMALDAKQQGIQLKQTELQREEQERLELENQKQQQETNITTSPSSAAGPQDDPPFVSPFTAAPSTPQVDTPKQPVAIGRPASLKFPIVGPPKVAAKIPASVKIAIVQSDAQNRLSKIAAVAAPPPVLTLSPAVSTLATPVPNNQLPSSNATSAASATSKVPPAKKVVVAIPPTKPPPPGGVKVPDTCLDADPQVVTAAVRPTSLPPTAIPPSKPKAPPLMAPSSSNVGGPPPAELPKIPPTRPSGPPPSAPPRTTPPSLPSNPPPAVPKVILGPDGRPLPPSSVLSSNAAAANEKAYQNKTISSGPPPMPKFPSSAPPGNQGPLQAFSSTAPPMSQPADFQGISKPTPPMPKMPPSLYPIATNVNSTPSSSTFSSPSTSTTFTALGGADRGVSRRELDSATSSDTVKGVSKDKAGLPISSTTAGGAHLLTTASRAKGPARRPPNNRISFNRLLTASKFPSFHLSTNSIRVSNSLPATKNPLT